MEAIIFIGLQASGKSSFYKEHFFNSHLRISNDLLKTKSRETKLLELCFESSMPLLIDNTNVTKAVRQHYIEKIKARHYRLTAYYFKTDLERSLAWNQQRKEVVPPIGIFATHKKLELPSYDEGFDQLYYVDFIDGKLTVTDWKK
ncbi:AAA family ATPase [Undibacterium sp. Ji83W]|uniref:AAA family ATPase n=1 Tax=Undibacterium sp. Ji83W TaxID=3413043 RepID=UPI003BF04292